jgi:hypothetical protein
VIKVRGGTKMTSIRVRTLWSATWHVFGTISHKKIVVLWLKAHPKLASPQRKDIDLLSSSYPLAAGYTKLQNATPLIYVP